MDKKNIYKLNKNIKLHILYKYNVAKYKLLIIFIYIILLNLISCTVKTSLPVKDGISLPSTQTILLKSTPPEKPDWIYLEPSFIGDYLYFVGISEHHSLERDARNSARRDAVRTFAGYCGVYIFDLYQRVSTSLNLSTGVMDPSVATKQQQEQIIDAYVSRVRTKRWYIEEWATVVDGSILEKYFIVYVYAEVPKDEYDRVIELKSQQTSYQYRYVPLIGKDWEKENIHLQHNNNEDFQYYYFFASKNLPYRPSENNIKILKNQIYNSIIDKFNVNINNNSEVKIIDEYLEYDNIYTKIKDEVKVMTNEKRPIEFTLSIRGRVHKKIGRELNRLRGRGSSSNHIISEQISTRDLQFEYEHKKIKLLSVEQISSSDLEVEFKIGGYEELRLIGISVEVWRGYPNDFDNISVLQLERNFQNKKLLDKMYNIRPVPINIWGRIQFRVNIPNELLIDLRRIWFTGKDMQRNVVYTRKWIFEDNKKNRIVVPENKILRY